MESQKPKIAMYVKRNFGEKLSASFTDLSYSSAEFERTDGIYSGAD